MDHFIYNAFYLFIPMLLIRYFILRLVKEDGLKRAAFEPPVQEKLVNFLYHISINVILLYMFFLTIHFKTLINFIGIGLYIIGVIFYLLSTINYGKHEDGLNKNGLYRFSRNPMYVAFFLFLLGCVFITNSYVLSILVLIYQLSTHYVIKAEEKWCIEVFKEQYIEYMKKVRRYL